MKHIICEWLGSSSFKNSLVAQKNRALVVANSDKIFVVGYEYSPVITLGKRALEARELKTNRNQLGALGISVEDVDRGGEATMHMPGQVVIYPIINLRELGMGVKGYLNLLLKVTHKVLLHYSVNAAIVSKKPGLYTDKGKISFFGVRVHKGVTTHGLAINVSNDLNLFKHIRSCGRDNENFDSLKLRGIDASCQSVFDLWGRYFSEELSGVNLNDNSRAHIVDELPGFSLTTNA